MISEIRTIAADDLWMSPCYKQASVAIHFTWKQDWAAVGALLPIIEQVLAPFNARPHWGKLFTMSPASLAALYAQLPAFRKVAAKYDPRGKFRNAFLDKYIFGARECCASSRPTLPIRLRSNLWPGKVPRSLSP